MTEEVRNVVADRTGIDTDVLGAPAVDRAIAARMAACSISDPGAYVRLLDSSKREKDNLVEQMAVLETWFFRDRGPFDFLQQYARKRQRLRVLSAACATGEEAYSIAIALVEAGLPAGSFVIDACDISRRALAVASRAIYPAASFREEWHDHRSRWFEPVAGGFALRPEISGLVRFHHDDLLHPVFLATQPAYDVVYCRNVLIYFRPEAQQSLIQLIGRLVVADGIVITGHAEVNILLRQGYETVGDLRCFACRKRTPAILPPPPKEVPAVVANAIPATPGRTPQPESEKGQLLQRARQMADQGAFEDAWSLCERWLAQHSDPDAYFLEGVISSARNRLNVAQECFRKALYLDPRHYQSLIQMGLLCEREGKMARARLFRERAAKLNRPEETDAQRA